MNKLKRLLAPEIWVWFHALATLTWIVLLFPALIWWKESVPFLVLISVWANIASHWACFQASQGEKRTKQQNGDSDGAD